MSLDLDAEYSAVMVEAWKASPELAAVFQEAVKQACAGQPWSREAMLAAWESIPVEAREQFCAAISERMKRLWSDPEARAEQSERIKRTYNDNLRESRRASMKRRWADGEPALIGATLERWSDPAYRSK